MEFVFYISAIIAVLATVRVVTHTRPVYALLYLIISLLSISAVFFSLGAYFAAALEVIVYAGAIMVLFVFVVMMLNLGAQVEAQERAWLTPKTWVGPSILAAVLLVVLLYGISSVTDAEIAGNMIDAKAVGISLFGPYVLAVELVSMLLLAGIVVAYHLGRENRAAEADVDAQRANNQSEEQA